MSWITKADPQASMVGLPSRLPPGSWSRIIAGTGAGGHDQATPAMSCQILLNNTFRMISVSRDTAPDQPHPGRRGGSGAHRRHPVAGRVRQPERVRSPGLRGIRLSRSGRPQLAGCMKALGALAGRNPEIVLPPPKAPAAGPAAPARYRYSRARSGAIASVADRGTPHRAGDECG